MATKDANKATQDIGARWGNKPEIRASLDKHGFVGVPAVFLRRMSSVGGYGLTPAEAMFIIQVMSYKWSADAPFPAYKSIAERIGVSEVYARKLAKSLEQKGLLRRIRQKGTMNRYDLSPLFDALAKEVNELDKEKGA